MITTFPLGGGGGGINHGPTVMCVSCCRVPANSGEVDKMTLSRNSVSFTPHVLLYGSQGIVGNSEEKCWGVLVGCVELSHCRTVALSLCRLNPLSSGHFSIVIIQDRYFRN